ncbi:trypsin 3A1-like [Cylas formicarius]|uniref:trypsin 3A1-like n=1 Tax=Cylas formicarius TaxID=197179 RepID=UPI002958A062|nr:trypsin 3A1-like [Cylas formicarius]
MFSRTNTVLLFTFLFSGCCSSSFSGIQHRIVGGQAANITQYPYQVSIAFDGEHGCGGSILTVKFVLSAAHCFASETKGKRVTVRAGSSFRTTGGQVVATKSIQTHASFNADTYDYDVAVLELASSLTLGTGVATIKLTSASSKIANGQVASVAGWGFTSNDGEVSYQLQAVTLPLITTQNCRKYYGTKAVTDRMICAGYGAGGKDSCIGDSGGPLVSNGLQVGIVSWGDVCGQASTPGVYTQISSVLSFIQGIVKF